MQNQARVGQMSFFPRRFVFKTFMLKKPQCLKSHIKFLDVNHLQFKGSALILCVWQHSYFGGTIVLNKNLQSMRHHRITFALPKDYENASGKIGKNLIYFQNSAKTSHFFVIVYTSSILKPPLWLSKAGLKLVEKVKTSHVCAVSTQQ